MRAEATAVAEARFEIHGVAVRVTSEVEAWLDPLRRRLSSFLTTTYGDDEIRFAFRRLSPGRDHVVRGRTVYDSSAGPVLYDAVSDRLALDAPTVRLTCDCGDALVTIEVDDRRPNLEWLVSRPLFTLPLIELLKRRGLYSVHASAVAAGNGVLMICAPTGAGKSTLALALALSGMELLADDMVFIRVDEKPTVCGLTEELDVTPESALLFPVLAHRTRHAPPDGWPKHRLAPERLGSIRMGALGIPLALLFLDKQHEGPPRFESLAPADALLELAPNVLLTEPSATQAHLHALGAVAHAVPSRRFATGGTLSCAVEALHAAFQ